MTSYSTYLLVPSSRASPTALPPRCPSPFHHLLPPFKSPLLLALPSPSPLSPPPPYFSPSPLFLLLLLHSFLFFSFCPPSWPCRPTTFFLSNLSFGTFSKKYVTLFPYFRTRERHSDRDRSPRRERDRERRDRDRESRRHRDRDKDREKGSDRDREKREVGCRDQVFYHNVTT